MTHPVNHIETLLAYADGMLTPTQASAVEAHLAAHPEDAQLVEHYCLIKRRVAEDDSVEPSRSAIARAHAVFKPASLPKRERMTWLTAVDCLIARCVFDSRVEALAVRSAAAEQLVNVSFEAPNMDIDLQADRMESSVGDGPSRWQILGQINSSAKVGGARIALTQSGSILPLVECSADEHGSFSVQTPPGRYDLHIELFQHVVVLPDLDMT